MRLIPVSENEDDYARVPELVAATPAHHALRRGAKPHRGEHQCCVLLPVAHGLLPH